MEIKQPPPREDPSESATPSRSLLGSAAGVGVVTLLSRITGLVREQVTAYFLGTSAASDAFNISFLIPNLLRRLVGEGAMTAAFVPTFTEYLKKRSRDEVWSFAASFFWMLFLVLAALTALGIVAAPVLISHAFAPGFADTPGKTELTTFLLRLMFAYTLFIGLAALAQAVLNSLGRFAVPAFTPVLLNLAIVSSALLFARRLADPSLAFALGVLAGGFLQFTFQYPFLLRVGFRLTGGVRLLHPGVLSVLRLMAPAVFGAGIYQINVAVARAIATYQGGGAVASLGFSSRLLEVVLGIFVVSLSTVILPEMSRQAIRNDREAMVGTLSLAVRMVALVTIPATVGIAILRTPLVNLIFRFKGGSFDALSTALTSHALLFHILGLAFIGWTRILVPVFYSFKNIRLPVIVATFSMVVNIALCLTLTSTFAHGGIALANSLAAAFQAAILVVLARRLLGRIDATAIARSLGKMIVASAAMGCLCHTLRGTFALASLSDKVPLAGYTALIVAAGTTVYFLVLLALRSPELSDLAGLVKGRR